jgi:hypothetical protein
MCLDCGCGEPNERHGDDRHITMDDVKAAAEASEISVDEAARNIADGVRQAQSAGSADGSYLDGSDRHVARRPGRDPARLGFPEPLIVRAHPRNAAARVFR